MKRKGLVVFESPSPGSRASTWIGDDEVLFELEDCSSVLAGSGRSEFWGQQIIESFEKHYVDKASILEVNGESYDTKRHGLEGRFFDGVEFVVEYRY